MDWLFLTQFVVPQRNHNLQYEEKRNLLQDVSAVDDMYEMLTTYEQKVSTTDQVRAPGPYSISGG
jgi:hypothetical protein